MYESLGMCCMKCSGVTRIVLQDGLYWLCFGLYPSGCCGHKCLRETFHVASFLFTLKTALKGGILILLSSSLCTLPLCGIWPPSESVQLLHAMETHPEGSSSSRGSAQCCRGVQSRQRPCWGRGEGAEKVRGMVPFGRAASCAGLMQRDTVPLSWPLSCPASTVGKLLRRQTATSTCS